MGKIVWSHRASKYATDTPVASVRALGRVNQLARLRAYRWYLRPSDAERHVPFLVDVTDAYTKFPLPSTLSLRAYRLPDRPTQTQQAAVLDFMDARERAGTLAIIGNGGAGGCGLFLVIADRIPSLTVVWHGGDSDENFEHAYAMHAAVTYEPHMELRFLADNGERRRRATTVFVNRLLLVYPDARFGTYFESLPSRRSPHERVGYALVMWAMRHPRTFQYLSRYNHSGIGEHDRLMFTLGCARAHDHYRKTFPTVTHLLQHFVMTFVVRDQTLLPGDVTRTGDGLFYLNDAAFVRPSSRTLPITIDNPAQLWSVPLYPVPKWYVAVLRALRSDMVSEFTCTTSRPVASGDDTYIQSYLRLHHDAYAVAPEAYIQDWTLLQPRAARYAHVRCSRTCRVDSSVTVNGAITSIARRKRRSRTSTPRRRGRRDRA